MVHGPPDSHTPPPVHIFGTAGADEARCECDSPRYFTSTFGCNWCSVDMFIEQSAIACFPKFSVLLCYAVAADTQQRWMSGVHPKHTCSITSYCELCVSTCDLADISGRWRDRDVPSDLVVRWKLGPRETNLTEGGAITHTPVLTHMIYSTQASFCAPVSSSTDAYILLVGFVLAAI